MTNKPEKTDELLDELLKGGDSPEAILVERGLLKPLSKRLVERALEAELTERLGYRSHAREGWGNGKSKKTVQSEAGAFEMEVPRDYCNASFEPQLVKKRQRLPAAGRAARGL